MKIPQLWLGVLIAGSLGLGSLAWADEDEEPVTLDQVPPAVRATIQRESRGATLEDLHLEADRDQTVYGAEIVKDGQAYEVHIARDGTVINRVTEEDEEDED